MRLALAFACLATLLPFAGRAQDACGRDGPACEVDGGSYRASLPAAPAGAPVMIFFHGAGGSGAGTLGMTGMVATFTNAGWAVLAPDGLPRPNSRFGPGWSFHPLREERRDESAFARAVLDDAAARWGLDRGRVLVSGFSIGGSLVWYMACEDPALGAAYAPVAGAFWQEPPETCAGPMRLLHTHGWRDRVVPLEGRPLRDEIYQGDVFAGLAALRTLNGCTAERADVFETEGTFWRRAWEACTPGTALELALHPGGHGVPEGWAAMAIDWFEGLKD